MILLHVSVDLFAPQPSANCSAHLITCETQGEKGVSDLRQVIFSTDRIKVFLTHTPMYQQKFLRDTILDTPAHSKHSVDLGLLPQDSAHRRIQLQQQEE